jgi:hypothetical protein
LQRNRRQIYRRFTSLPYRPGKGAARPSGRSRAAFRAEARFRGIAMAEYADEHERTMAFAEIALGQIKALR